MMSANPIRLPHVRWGYILRQTMARVLQCHCRLCQTPLADTLEPQQPTPPQELCASALPALRELGMICSSCAQQLPWLKPAETCQHCLTHATHVDESGRCHHCVDGLWAAVDGVFAPWRYAHPINRLIVRAKHQPDLALAHYAAMAMSLSTLTPMFSPTAPAPHLPFAARIPDWLPEIHGLLPLPLYRTRARWRGFNQAYALTDALAKVWRQTPERVIIPVHDDWVEKIRDTGSQNQRNRQERFRSVKNAFAAASAVRGKNLIVVDDVMTSGATMLSLAQTLKKAGARRVYAIVMARAVFQADA